MIPARMKAFSIFYGPGREDLAKQVSALLGGSVVIEAGDDWKKFRKAIGSAISNPAITYVCAVQESGKKSHLELVSKAAKMPDLEVTVSYVGPGASAGDVAAHMYARVGEYVPERPVNERLKKNRGR